MNIENIVARLRAMADNARCRDCWSTIAACAEEEVRDPKGPRRCCERCGHTISFGAVRALAREVESGEVAPPKEPTPAPAKTGMSWFEYLNQGEKWQPNGKPLVAIADMDAEWRYNAAQFLERRAPIVAAKYQSARDLWFIGITSSPLGPSENSADGIERDIEREDAEIDRDPLAWIRTTKLHRALVGGLPTKPKEVEKLAERARHWSTCPARTGAGDCRCEQIRAEHDAATDTTPEWTI